MTFSSVVTDLNHKKSKIIILILALHCFGIFCYYKNVTTNQQNSKSFQLAGDAEQREQGAEVEAVGVVEAGGHCHNCHHHYFAIVIFAVVVIFIILAIDNINKSNVIAIQAAIIMVHISYPVT